MEKTQIPVERSPKEVDIILKDVFGIGLFKFAQVFAVCPAHMFIQKRDSPFNTQEINQIRSALQKTWKALLENAGHVEALFGNFRKGPAKVSPEDELLNEKAFSDFYVQYLLPRDYLLYFLEKTHQLGKKGSGINKKTIIALGWANLVSRNCPTVNWYALSELYFWFWERIRPYKFYREWRPPEGIEDYFKTQFYRYRLADGLETYIAKNIQVADIQDITGAYDFCLKLIMYKWSEGQIPEVDIPRVVLNLVTDWYLAANDGVTIFSPSESFADPFFGYLGLWLKKKRNISLPKSIRESPNKGVFLWSTMTSLLKELR